MWPVGQGPPARKATVVEPAFSASFRKPPARPNLASAIEEEEEDVTEIPGYYGKASAQESESKLKVSEPDTSSCLLFLCAGARGDSEYGSSPVTIALVLAPHLNTQNKLVSPRGEPARDLITSAISHPRNRICVSAMVWQMGEIGDYLLRESVSTAGSYVLCIKLSQIKVVQLKIVVNPNGTYSVPGAKAQFLTFGRLIAADPNAKRPVAARQSNPVSPTRRVPQPFI